MKRRKLKLTAAIGLFTGGFFGIVGSVAPSPSLRCVAWGIDGVGLILASTLLSIYYVKRGMDITAAGFVIFAIGEGLVLSSSGIDLDEHISTFGAGTGLWATSLFVISFQKTYPLFIRITGLLAAILFSVVSVLVFTEHPVNALTRPLPFYVYPVFVITIFGWAWTLLRKPSSWPIRNS